MHNKLVVFACWLLLSPHGNAQSIFDSLRVGHRAEVYFAFGKHDLDGAALAALDAFAEDCAALQKPFQVRITAHTDSIGNAENNLALSQRRARAVQAGLEQRGLAAEKIRTAYFGERRPTTENSTEEGRQRNRRATLEILHHIPMTPYAGQVTDKNTGEGIPAILHFSTRMLRDSVQTDSSGRFSVQLPQDSVVKTEAYAPGRFFESVMQKMYGPPEMLRRMRAEPLVIPLPSASSGEKVAIKNLFFVGNEAVLLKSSEPELPKVLKFMQVNPDIRIEIAGHINNPLKKPDALEKWERELSVNRAKLVHDYLLKNGIEPDRVAYKGYGNTEMLFPDPGMSEEKQAQNRRVEIRVQ